MRCVRLCRRQSPSTCWNSNMRRITTKILKALRFVLSRFGLASAAPLTPYKDQSSVHQSALTSSEDGTRERLTHQPAEAGSVDSRQESDVDESSKAIQGRNEVEGQTDSEPVEKGTPAASVPQKRRRQNADAGSDRGVGSEGDRSEGVVAATEHDLTRCPVKMGVDEPSAEEPPRNEETGYEAPPRTVPEGRIANGDKNRHDSAPPKDAGAGDSDVDQRSVQEDTLQTDEVAPCSDPHPPLEVQHKRITAMSSPNAGERTAEDACADTSSTNPASLPNENRCGGEASSEPHRTASVGAGKSDSGFVDRPQAAEELHRATEEDAWATSDDRRVPPRRQPTPPEDAHEYVVAVQDVSAVDREYARWNNAIVEQLLLAGPSSEEALLCVNPRILARIFEEAGLGPLTPEQAEQQFTTAVANLYQRRVLRHSARLRVLRRCSADGSPDCTAFLAGSVLAAFRMQSDKELSGNAYYRRLADLLKCEMHGAHPLGFNPRVFESLWMFLHNWLRRAHGRQLAIPKSDIGFRRFVALPLAHVPLRSLDIEKLPGFFSWAGYQPGARVGYDRLLSDIKRWQQLRNMLTPTGTSALYDDRSAAVSAQASAELEAWDGSFCESAHRRSAFVDIQFDVVQRSPVFFYLPRRPPGFPKVFEYGERVFEASDVGWYDPAQLRPEDGELLESGFEWLTHIRGIDFTLRRSGALAIPFTPSSNYSGFLSGRRLLRGVRCSVLCHENIVPTVKDYLSEVAQVLLSPISHSLLPNGWSLFRDVAPRVHVEAPAGLEALEVDPKIELIVSGGLRLGRHWSWLPGAPPRVLVSGMEPQDRITVNGASMGVDASGELMAEGVFVEPGDYHVVAGRVRRNITIEPPQVSVQSRTELHESLDASRKNRIALPHGSWTLVGNSPDEVCYSDVKFFRGTIASCPFHPSWAIQVGAGPGAVVAVDSCPRQPRVLTLRKQTVNTRKLIEQWSRVIYEAHIRRPRFVGLNGAVPDEGIVKVWKSYATLAKKIKRQLKKPR